MKIASYVLLVIAIMAAVLAFKFYVFFPAVDDLTQHGMTATNCWAVVFIVLGVAVIPWRVLRYIRRANDHGIPPNVEKKPDSDDGGSFW